MAFSKRWTLNLTDFQKGFIMAVGGAIYGIIYPIIKTWLKEPGWLLPYIDWKLVLESAFTATVVYLGKNWISPTPKTITIDPSKTIVIDAKTKEPVVSHVDLNATLVKNEQTPNE